MSRPDGGSNCVGTIAVRALMNGLTTEVTVSPGDQMDFNRVQVAHSQLALCLRTVSPTAWVRPRALPEPPDFPRRFPFPTLPAFAALPAIFPTKPPTRATGFSFPPFMRCSTHSTQVQYSGCLGDRLRKRSSSLGTSILVVARASHHSEASAVSSAAVLAASAFCLASTVGGTQSVFT